MKFSNLVCVFFSILFTFSFLACDNGNEPSKEVKNPFEIEEFVKGKTFYSSVTITRPTSTGSMVFAENENTCKIAYQVPYYANDGTQDGMDVDWINCNYQVNDGVITITTTEEEFAGMELTIDNLKSDGTFTVDYPAALVAPEVLDYGIETITLSYFLCTNGFVGKVWDDKRYTDENGYRDCYSLQISGDWYFFSRDDDGEIIEPRERLIQENMSFRYGGWLELDFISTSEVTINYDINASYTVSGNTATITVPGGIGTFTITTDSELNMSDEVFLKLLVFIYRDDKYYLNEEDLANDEYLLNPQIEEWYTPLTIVQRW